MTETKKILCGDALAVLRTLPDGCVNMCVTSPPYYGLRDYGMDGQIGLEPSPAEYVSRLVAVFRELRRVLTPDGVLFLNIADSYAGSGKGASAKTGQKCKHRYLFMPDNPAANIPIVWPEIKPKDMVGIPWATAFALRADGWYLRSDIIWQKVNALPHSVKDRPVSSYEHIFLLAKSKRYYFDYRALEEPTLESSKQRFKRNFGSNKYAKGAPGQCPQTINKRDGRDFHINEKRRGRDIWSFPTSPLRGVEHYAAYPLELARRCILAGCPEGGVVLDPFIGSGTTGAAALMLGRRYIGIELNPEYILLAEKRIEQYRQSEQPRETEESACGAVSA
jgi:DNA modification methylase